MQTATIKVLIVDDHDILRKGLAISLSSAADIELVGAASDGGEAVRQCGVLAPDVVLMDLIMPEMDGVTATRLIRERYPQTQVVALTSFDEKSLVQAAINAGAISYLIKNVSVDELVSAIRDAYHGKSTFSPQAMQALISVVREPVVPDYNLTARELEVLSYIIKGMSNSEIAQHLYISGSTAKKHVGNILAKLDVANRAEAVAIAMQYKLVPME